MRKQRLERLSIETRKRFIQNGVIIWTHDPFTEAILTKLEVLWLISKFSYFIMITDQKDITSPVLTFKIFILKI